MEEEKREVEEIEKSPNEELLKIKRSNSKKNAIIVILVFVVILLIALLLLYFFNNKDKGNGENGGTPVVTATPSANTNDELLYGKMYTLISKQVNINSNHSKISFYSPA